MFAIKSKYPVFAFDTAGPLCYSEMHRMEGMPVALFNSAEDQARKDNLKRLEDRRLAFAQRLSAQGFAPEDMLFSQRDDGGFTAISRFDGRYWVIVGPGFGTDDDFALYTMDALDYRAQEVFQKAEGMGGIFGFGKKAEVGMEFVIALPDGGETRMAFVSGRTGWLRASLKKNPLLKTKRRRGDANVVWDFRPMDRGELEGALRAATAYFPENQ